MIRIRMPAISAITGCTMYIWPIIRARSSVVESWSLRLRSQRRDGLAIDRLARLQAEGFAVFVQGVQCALAGPAVHRAGIIAQRFQPLLDLYDIVVGER